MDFSTLASGLVDKNRTRGRIKIEHSAFDLMYYFINSTGDTKARADKPNVTELYINYYLCDYKSLCLGGQSAGGIWYRVVVVVCVCVCMCVCVCVCLSVCLSFLVVST